MMGTKVAVVESGAGASTGLFYNGNFLHSPA